ncbi:hypothetical protein QEN19_003965 [Hanseniaspora menglaensis]
METKYGSTQDLETDTSFNESLEEENKTNNGKLSGFGIRKRLRSGYNKRFGSMISGATRNDQGDVTTTEVRNKGNFGKIAKNGTNGLVENTGDKDALPELNMENTSNTSLYLLRRNNSRQNSRSNSLVNSLYLNNLNNSGINHTGLHVNTNTNSGYITPKNGPETPAMATPTIGYNHRYQNSVSSFSSIDIESSNIHGGFCTPTPTTIAFPPFLANPIELTNEFTNIFKQEYENYCSNPKTTPFDHSNPPPGVIEIIFKKSKWHIKVQKLVICRNNKNNLNLDNNDELYHKLKLVLKDNVYSSRRNVSRANSVSSFQLDMNYPLKYNSSHIESNASFDLKPPSVFPSENTSFSSCLDKVSDIIFGEEDNAGNHTNATIHISSTNSPSRTIPSNPILFSPRKLKREDNMKQGNIDNFDNMNLLEKQDSNLSSIASLEELKDTSRGFETPTEPQFILESAPKIEKRRN